MSASGVLDSPMANRGWLSPDGQSIAYEPLTQWQGDWKHYHGGQTQPIWIAKLADSSIEKVPRQNSNDKCPMWVGDKVYFLSDRNLRTAVSSPWGIYQPEPYFDKKTQIYQVALTAGLRSPFAPPNV